MINKVYNFLLVAFKMLLAATMASAVVIVRDMLLRRKFFMKALRSNPRRSVMPGPYLNWGKLKS